MMNFILIRKIKKVGGKMSNVPILETSPGSIEQVSGLTKLINDYGFMIVFSAIVLLLIIVFFLNQQKTVMKKNQAELDIMSRERNASIEQNKQMFELVTKVQTDQVVQLQQMTETLANMNRSLRENQHQLDIANDTFEKVKNTMIDYDLNHRNILSGIDGILSHICELDKSTKELEAKIEFIEKAMRYIVALEKRKEKEHKDNVNTK